MKINIGQKIIKYKNVESRSLGELNEIVNNHLKGEWTIYGEMQIFYRTEAFGVKSKRYLQTLVVYDLGGS